MRILMRITMRAGRKRATAGLSIAVAALAIALALPSIAMALRSYYGGNYSEDFNRARQVRVCDREPDGRAAYTHYQATGSSRTHRIDDENGARRGCTPSRRHTHIFRHRVCEHRPNWRDHCGRWRYPK